MTGLELIDTPYANQSSAPSIWAARMREGCPKKYDATKTAVAPHPNDSLAT